MRAEWGSDEGRAAAAGHRQAMLAGISRVRRALDDFAPDFVLIWGDDQYENFRETVIPAFTVQAYEDITVHPWRDATASAMFDAKVQDQYGGGRPNVWNETANTAFTVKGHRQGALHLVEGLLANSFDVAYAYEPLNHPGLAHAFLNAILYLDYERRGFPYPVVTVPINCYGRSVISYRGFASPWGERGRRLDPPSPSPGRCFEFGAAMGRILHASPWRVAIIASSSWSHAFLVDKTYRIQPDVAADRFLYEALVAGDYDTWRDTPLSAIEDAGQHEVLNWFALAGAMQALDMPIQWSEFVETWVFNSSKVAAITHPSR